LLELRVGGAAKHVGKGAHPEIIRLANFILAPVGIKPRVEKADLRTLAITHYLPFDAVGPGHNLRYRHGPDVASASFWVGANQLIVRNKHTGAQTLSWRMDGHASSHCLEHLRLFGTLNNAADERQQLILFSGPQYASPVVPVPARLSLVLGYLCHS